MGQVHPLPDQRREFIGDGDRSQLRATWHVDSGIVVISLWKDETCVATSHLSAGEAGRLSTFITGGLADLATGGRVTKRRRRFHPGKLRELAPGGRTLGRNLRIGLGNRMNSVARRLAR